MGPAISPGAEWTVLMVGSPECERKVTEAAVALGMSAESTRLEDFFRAFYARRPALVLFDLIERPESCLSAIRRVRELSEVPVAVLVPDQVFGLQALHEGADFTMTIPVRVEELELRLAGLLERSARAREKDLFSDEFVEVDLVRNQVTVRGRVVSFTPTEFRMLAALAERPGVAVTHRDLLDLVWGDAYRGREEVKLYISYLRRKLSAAGVDAIETVRGVGYRYAPRLEPAAGGPS